jgi:hypothetical protein
MTFTALAARGSRARVSGRCMAEGSEEKRRCQTLFVAETPLII